MRTEQGVLGIKGIQTLKNNKPVFLIYSLKTPKGHYAGKYAQYAHSRFEVTP